MLPALMAVVIWVRLCITIITKRISFKKLLQIQEGHVKKLVSVSTIFTSVISDSEEALLYAPYIYYLVWFWKDKENIQSLIDSDNKINTILPA